MALKNIWVCCAFCTVGFVFHTDQVFGQANSNEGSYLSHSQDPNPRERNTSVEQSSDGKERDGQHDFDFWLGTWKVHNRRLMHPLAGSTTWVEFEGAFVAKKLLDGRANMDEYEAESPSPGISRGSTCASIAPNLTSGASTGRTKRMGLWKLL